VQPRITKMKPSPNEQAENDRADELLAYSHMRNDCAAKVPCQQNRTKNRGLRKHINRSTGEFQYPKALNKTIILSEMLESHHNSLRLRQFPDAAQKQPVLAERS
jgi:hypothetical protein